MIRRLLPACFVLLLWGINFSRLDGAIHKKEIIRSIRIDVLDIFPSTKNIIKKFINNMHILTRKSVVKSILLYKKAHSITN